MPNWCINEVDMSFDCPMEEQLRIRKAIAIPLVEDFYKVNTDDWFSFEKIVPQPKHTVVPMEGTNGNIDKMILENGEEFNWYDWRNEHWGTKWDHHYLEIIDNDEKFISFSFDTAWCPPEGIHDKVREILGDHASMSWFYRESGMEIAGYLQ